MIWKKLIKRTGVAVVEQDQGQPEQQDMHSSSTSLPPTPPSSPPSPIPSHPHTYLLTLLSHARSTIQAIHLENLIESQPTPADRDRAASLIIHLALSLQNLTLIVEKHLRKPLPERRKLCAEDMFGRYEERMEEIPREVKRVVRRVEEVEKMLWRGATLAVLEGRVTRREDLGGERGYMRLLSEKMVIEGFTVEGIKGKTQLGSVKERVRK